MQRRRLLQSLLASLLLPLPLVSAAQTKRVLVVGAGMAGLAAAQRLQQAGWQVQVLEARDRVGGRLHTSQHWRDAPVDMGASWIHGTQGNPITALAAQANVPLWPFDGEQVQVYGADSRPLQQSQRQQLEQLQQRILWQLEQLEDDDPASLLDWLEEQLLPQLPAELTPWQRFVLSSVWEHEYGGSAAELSARWADAGQTFAGEDALFPQGYQALAAWLGRDLQLHLQHPVVAINWQDEVRLLSANGQQWQADYVLLTVPMGVLQQGQIVFSPPLPKPLTEAIKALPMGLLNKCYLRFEHVFWPEQLSWLELAQENTPWPEWVNLHGMTGLPILLGFTAAEQARTLEQQPDEAWVASAMQALRGVFGQQIPEPVDYQLSRWGQDPFSLGAYSYNAVGYQPVYRERLGQLWGGRLILAGEAASRDYFGTVHGAYLSGIAAADTLLESAV